MKTLIVTVGQGWRHSLTKYLEENGLQVVGGGYSDSSSTEWSVSVRTKLTPAALQKLVWKLMPNCSVAVKRGPQL